MRKQKFNVSQEFIDGFNWASMNGARINPHRNSEEWHAGVITALSYITSAQVLFGCESVFPPPGWKRSA